MTRLPKRNNAHREALGQPDGFRRQIRKLMARGRSRLVDRPLLFNALCLFQAVITTTVSTKRGHLKRYRTIAAKAAFRPRKPDELFADLNRPGTTCDADLIERRQYDVTTSRAMQHRHRHQLVAPWVRLLATVRSPRVAGMALMRSRGRRWPSRHMTRTSASITLVLYGRKAPAKPHGRRVLRFVECTLKISLDFGRHFRELV